MHHINLAVRRLGLASSCKDCRAGLFLVARLEDEAFLRSIMHLRAALKTIEFSLNRVQLLRFENFAVGGEHCRSPKFHSWCFLTLSAVHNQCSFTCHSDQTSIPTRFSLGRQICREPTAVL